VAEIPSLQRLYTSFSHQPFVLLPDPTSDVSQRWDADFLPTSNLIDAQGRMRYTAYGEVDWDDDEVRATLRELLEEADSRPASAD